MTNPSIAQIAEGLSEAQREKVLSLSGEWIVHPVNFSRNPAQTWLAPRLLETGCPTQMRTERLRLTPLGQQVAAHLRSRDDAK